MAMMRYQQATITLPFAKGTATCQGRNQEKNHNHDLNLNIYTVPTRSSTWTYTATIQTQFFVQPFKLLYSPLLVSENFQVTIIDF